MSIEVQCPQCGKRLRAPASQSSRKGKCPACQTPIVIPGEKPIANSTPEATASPQVIAAPVAEAPQITQEAIDPIADLSQIQVAPTVAATVDNDDQPSWLNSPKTEPSAERNRDGVDDGKHWYVLKVGLTVSEYALRFEAIAGSVLALTVLYLSFNTPGMTRGRASPDVGLAIAMSVLIMWGAVGLLLSWAAMYTSWFVCLIGTPDKGRGWIISSLWAGGASVITVLALISLVMIQAASGSGRFTSNQNPFTLPLAVSLSAGAAALVFFYFFLNRVQHQLNSRTSRTAPIVYAVVIGGLTVWCLFCNLETNPNNQKMARIVMLSNAGTTIIELVWLWIANLLVLRNVRMARPWERGNAA